eukprot:scaffold1492_cov259-Chaetoceros_neogracile.AAC.8
MSVKNRYCSVPWILVLLSSFLILNYNAQAEELSVCSTPESSKCIDDPEKIYAYLYPRCSECIGEERCSCEDNNEVNTNECKLRPFEYCKNCEGGTVENDCFGGLNTCFEDKKCILKSGGNGAQYHRSEWTKTSFCLSTLDEHVGSMAARTAHNAASYKRQAAKRKIPAHHYRTLQQSLLQDQEGDELSCEEMFDVYKECIYKGMQRDRNKRGLAPPTEESALGTFAEDADDE